MRTIMLKILKDFETPQTAIFWVSVLLFISICTLTCPLQP
jgi:hypothetical protein